MSCIKKDKLDDKYALLVKERNDYVCEDCGYQNRPEHLGCKEIDCAHVFSREVAILRVHSDNALCLCRDCHNKWGKEKKSDWHGFVILKIGQEKFDQLDKLRHQVYRKREHDLNFEYKRMKEALEDMHKSRMAGTQGRIEFRGYPG